MAAPTLFHASPTQAPSSLDTARAAVPHLLAKALSQPCSTGAQAFATLAPATARFQLALDALLPILEETSSNTGERVLAAYILFALYAPHPIAINPFASTLREVYVKEHDLAVSRKDGGGAGRDQFVWVLWKILHGDGEDLSPYSPSTLTRSPLPSDFQPENLTLDQGPSASTFLAHESLRSVNRSTTPSSYSSQLDFTQVDARTERISQGATLLLVARSRVLTLSEQRTLLPLISDLTSPALLTSLDLPPLAAHNPALAHALLRAVLSSPDSRSPGPAAAPPRLPSNTEAGFVHPPPPLTAAERARAFLRALGTLPPTLASLDLLGRLLNDESAVPDPFPPPFGAAPDTRTVSELVRAEALGLFLANAMVYLDQAEADERAGLVADDRFAVGVQHLCRFFSALITRGFVDPRDDAATAPMAAFALRHARLAAANALYRFLAGGGEGG